MFIRTLNKSETRYRLIDPTLVNAGWNMADRSQIWTEVLVQGYDALHTGGISDYCIY